MNATQRIRLGLLLTNLKLGGRFSFRTFVNDKDYPKDPDPKNWRTINGSKVHLSNGKIDGGAGEKFKGNEWHGKVAHGNNSFFPPKGWVKPPPPPKEPEPVPFGSEQPAPPKPNASGVPVAYINTLKGNFKKLSESKQATVKDLIKEAKKNGVPKELLDVAFEPEHHATIEKTIEALKAKQITPTAAQNVIAAAMYAPGNHGLKMLSEQWGGATTAAEDPFTSKEVHLPKKKEPAAKSATTTSEKAKNKIDLTKENEWAEHWDDMDEDEQSKYVNSVSQKFNIPIEKAALLMNLLQKPGFTDAKAEAKIKEWGGSVTQGVYKTPKNFKPHDYSEAAIGWKLPKGTMMPFTKSSDSDFVNYAIHSDADCMSMTKPQRTSVWRYTAGSEHIRDWLVYGKADTSWKDDDKEYKYKNKNWDNPYKNGMTGAAIQKVADDISEGLKKIDHPDMIVNRKCSLMDWATKDNPKGVSFEDLLQMAKTGEVFENKAFLSTSPMQGSTYGDSSACRHIYVPKKAVGGYIASVSEYKSEKEFLLDKKTKTRIMKVEKDKKGTIHVYEEVVLDD